MARTKKNTTSKEAGATLNRSKCEFATPSLKFLGHLIDENRIRADLIQPPEGIPEIRRFLGMVNQLGEVFEAFIQVKEELTQTPTPALYNPKADMKISADAS